MRIAGVDEAGRGCIIGPLVVAGALFNVEDIPILLKIGVKDSKKLTTKKREFLAKTINELIVDESYFLIQPKSIDRVVKHGAKLRKLNYLEAVAMAKVLRDLSPDEAFIDASDVNSERYRNTILNFLPLKPKLICEHKADQKYLVTSAASILAKVRRDSIVRKITEPYGRFYSGYPSDEKTITWLENLYKQCHSWPSFVRSSWKTIKRIEMSFNGMN